MANNLFNLALRFILELVALYFMARWGWVQHTGIVRYAITIGLPLLAATLWGVFRVPNDGGAPVIQVAGPVRLLIEIIYFGFATWGLFDIGAATTGWAFGAITLFHYIISYDRTLRLLKGQREL